MQQIYVTTTIGCADTVLTNASYQGPETTKAPTVQAKQYAIQLRINFTLLFLADRLEDNRLEDILDNYKCVTVTDEVVDVYCSQR